MMKRKKYRIQRKIVCTTYIKQKAKPKVLSAYADKRSMCRFATPCIGDQNALANEIYIKMIPVVDEKFTK